ncbi:hypothetical protein SESBI_01159 [Sesbania bispinosa]|nr:hypothetical protein SESBI_01159 [Sesbania bispinosa]
MRFFFEFVSCCSSPTRHAPEPAVPAEDEERWLVPASSAAVTATPSRRPCRKKQRRMGAPDWRPSLGSISEDSAVPPRERNGTVASAGRDAKKRGAAVGATKAHNRRYSDGYHGSVPAAE